MNTASIVGKNQDAYQRVMPQSLEAEQSTLGAMMMEREAIARAIELLRAEDFYREIHRQIFIVVVDLFNVGTAADLITVATECRNRGILESIGGAAYITALIESCPSAANIEYYACPVRELSLRRQAIQQAERAISSFYDTDNPLPQAIESWQKSAYSIGVGQQRGEFRNIGSICRDLLGDFQARRTSDGMSGVPTGYPDIDALLNGLQPSELSIWGGRPSMGKSALMLNMARNIALYEKLPVAIYSLEMSNKSLVERVITSLAAVNAGDLKRGRLHNEEWQRVASAAERLISSNVPIYIDDISGLTPFEMRAKARRLRSEVGDLAVIMVDYLQLAHGDKETGRHTNNRVQEVGEITNALKEMAKENACHVMALASLSRSVEQREDKRPVLSDLRESGDIEFAADVVAFVYRDSYYRKKGSPGVSQWGAESPDDNIAEIIFRKHRSGATGTVKLLWQAHLQRFDSLHQGNY